MPLLFSILPISPDISASKVGIRQSCCSMMVTWDPKRFQAAAISQPMTPPPTTISSSGSSLMLSIPVESSTQGWSSPSTSRCFETAPVAIIVFSAR